RRRCRGDTGPCENRCQKPGAAQDVSCLHRGPSFTRSTGRLGLRIGRRSVWLALAGGIGAATFAGYAFRPVTAPLGAAVLAFATGIGAYGWVGVFFVISAELGGVRRAGLLSGVAFASIVVGLLIGPAVFGLLLDHWDSYAVPWVIFATLAPPAPPAP